MTLKLAILSLLFVFYEGQERNSLGMAPNKVGVSKLGESQKKKKKKKKDKLAEHVINSRAALNEPRSSASLLLIGRRDARLLECRTDRVLFLCFCDQTDQPTNQPIYSFKVERNLKRTVQAFPK